MAFWNKKEGTEPTNTLHGRIAESDEFIQAARGKLVAAKDSIVLKKQHMQGLIAEAGGLHTAHDELDELKQKFNDILG